MDVELAVYALELAPHLDEMVLFSGDGDFRSPVEAVQRRGVHVTVISTISSQPPMIADELRRQADVRADIHDGQEHNNSNQRPDTLMQDRSPPARQNPLATHGRTIHSGHSRHFDPLPATSGPLPITDIAP